MVFVLVFSGCKGSDFRESEVERGDFELGGSAIFRDLPMGI
jgi:hypothetical protein